MNQEEKKCFEELKKEIPSENYAKLQSNLRELEDYEKVMRETEDFDINLTTTEKDVIREALVKMCWLFENDFLEDPKWHGVFQSLMMVVPLPTSGLGSSDSIAIFEWRRIIVALRNMLQLEYSEIEKMKFRDLAQKISEHLPKVDK